MYRASWFRVAALACAAVAVVATCAAAPWLWQIGQRDGSAAEFNLGPGGWRDFRDDALYVIGESTPKADWPFVEPGPSDLWAGHREHSFAIVFGLDRVASGGECQFIVRLIDAQSNVPPNLRIDINGHRFERVTRHGHSDGPLKGDASQGTPQQIAVTFPTTYLHRGDNTIQITTTTGSWVIYDWLGFKVPAGTTLAPVAARTIIAHVDSVRALEAHGGGFVQPLKVTLRHFAAPAEATIRVRGATPVRLALQRGNNTAEVLVPAVKTEAELRVNVDVAGRALPPRTVTVRPVRKLTLYLLPHSHTDIGYTQIQTAVADRQVQNLVDGMAAARRTATYPAGARFVWNVEVLWAVDMYLHRMDAAHRAAFLQAVKDGQVALNGMYVNELTGLCRPEELLRLFRTATELEHNTGVKIDSAMISDVPGYTWGTVTALTQAGIRYLSAAPNYFDRIGDSVIQWQDKPFYWVSPSGRHKVLVWVPFRGYALSHIYHDLSRRLLDDLQADLDRVNYPYDIAYTRWAGHGDNAVPDPAICDFVKTWDAKYAWPKLVISSTSTAFHALEQRYAAKLPVYYGDWTPYWEDGAASSARETALNRNASDRLTQAETLWAMRNQPGYPAQAFDDAWRNVLLYSEHTWGAAGSVWDPLSATTKAQWEIKRGYAVRADAESAALLRRAGGEALAATAPRVQPAGAPLALDVYNTNSWPRTDLVVVDKVRSAGRDRVVDATGHPIASQRLRDGDLAFLAREVPPFGMARYTLAAGTPGEPVAEQPRGSPAAPVTVGPSTLDNGLVHVRIDPRTGAIAELRVPRIDRNLAGRPGLNDYLYLRQSDLANLQHNGPVHITIEDAGPLVATLRVESPAPGCRSLTREVRLVAGSPAVMLTDTLDKERAPIAPHPNDHVFAQTEGKESVNLGFPFDIPGGDVRIDLPIGSMRPDKDQIPGACKNWFTVGRWIDVANADYGVTCVTLDAPLIEVGGITARLLGSQRDPSVWRQAVAPTTTFYSWVMNNHWGTNYRAYQEGPTVFRYVLWPHGRPDYAAASRRAIGCTQPLVVMPSTDTSRPPLAPRLRLSTDAVVVSSFKPADDGHGWIVRLYGASGKDTSVTLTWSTPVTTWLSDTEETAIAPITGPVLVPRWGIVTLRVQ